MSDLLRGIQDKLSTLEHRASSVSSKSAQGSGTLVLVQNVFGDVPGASVTFTVAGAAVAVVFAAFDLYAGGVTGNLEMQGRILLDGATPVGGIAELKDTDAEQRATVAAIGTAGVTAGSHTISLQAQKLGAAGSGQVSQYGTSLVAIIHA